MILVKIVLTLLKNLGIKTTYEATKAKIHKIIIPTSIRQPIFIQFQMHSEDLKKVIYAV
jgi:hypothetical protein